MPTFNNGAGYFLYVKDISEVYNYNVPQGSTMFFMNKDQPVLYLKSVNMFNQQDVTIYDLVEQPKPVQPQPLSGMQPSNYPTRDEITKLIQDTIRSEMRGNRGGYRNPKKEE